MRDDRRKRWLSRAFCVLCGSLALACHSGDLVPTYDVARRTFTHRVQAEGFLMAAEVTEVSVPAEVRRGARILWMVEDGTKVEAGDVVLRLDHYDMEQRYLEEVAESDAATVAMERTRVEGQSRVDAVTTRKEQSAMELEHAERYRRDDPHLFSKLEIAESEIQEEISRARRDFSSELEGLEGRGTRARTDLVDIERQQAQIEMEIAQDALEALDIRAPRSGILTWRRDWQGETPRIGEQVVRRQVLAEMPDPLKLQAEVFVLEPDASGVVPGKPAEVIIESHPERAFAAQVAWVDPVAKRRYRGSPVQYFGAILELEDVNREIMRIGQRVRATILVDQITDALVVPRQALFVEEGRYIVYREEGRSFPATEIEVLVMSPGLAVVEGLAEGTKVALEEPGPAAAESRRSGLQPSAG